jgi:hypothetical protein
LARAQPLRAPNIVDLSHVISTESAFHVPRWRCSTRTTRNSVTSLFLFPMQRLCKGLISHRLQRRVFRIWLARATAYGATKDLALLFDGQAYRRPPRRALPCTTLRCTFNGAPPGGFLRVSALPLELYRSPTPKTGPRQLALYLKPSPAVVIGRRVRRARQTLGQPSESSC